MTPCSAASAAAAGLRTIAESASSAVCRTGCEFGWDWMAFTCGGEKQA